MDHQSEQSMELEALQSIYPDSLSIMGEGEEYSITLTSTCTVDEVEEDQDQDQAIIDDSYVTLTVKYTATYPEEAPELEVTLSDMLEESASFRRELEQMCRQICAESLGMAMIFSVTSSIQEYLDTHVQSLIDTRHREEEERKRAEEERDNAKFIGTPVTLESFLKWRHRFDQELAQLNSAAVAKAKLNIAKLTGRQLFERDSGLAVSDVKYIDDGDVAVDTSLFQEELENLDLEDDDEEGGLALELSDSD